MAFPVPFNSHTYLIVLQMQICVSYQIGKEIERKKSATILDYSKFFTIPKRTHKNIKKSEVKILNSEDKCSMKVLK